MKRAKGVIVSITTLALTVAGVVFGNFTASATHGTWWHPSSATPLPMHWVLDTGTGDPVVDVNNPWHIGQRSLTGATLPPPAVLDVDGDYNTRRPDLGQYAHGSNGVGETFHARGQKVICYMDAGVQEMNGTNTVFDREPPYRFPTDRHDRQSGWGGYWIDFTEPGNGTRNPDPRVLAVIEKRIVDWCLPLGADAIEFDEVDYEQNNPLTSDLQGIAGRDAQVAYNLALADLAHKYNMAAVHKGAIHLTRFLVDRFDATLNEECEQYRECVSAWDEDEGVSVPGLNAYANAGKAVWNAEYRATPFSRLCSRIANNGYHWNGARYKLGLPANGGRQPCSYVW